MGLFSKKTEGGLMDVIRCDEQEYLVWKWRPSGEANSTKKENAIRYGSSLRVKDGETAVFVYKQNDGTLQDFITGPFDDIVKTANFPVLTGIVGMAFGGGSPFQAEVYYINTSGNVQIKFGVPYFQVFDPRFLDFGVTMAVRGTITFNITDCQAFIKLNRLINFELEDLNQQVKALVVKYTKSVITNAPSDSGMPVLQIERKIAEISDMIQQRLAVDFSADFGINLKRFDISAIDIDKEDASYKELRKVTADQQTKTIDAQTDISIKNLQDTQEINATNMEETLAIQREEAQRAQRLQTESNFMGAHSLDQQTEVLKTAAASLGSMGSMGGGEGGGGGMSPAGMMTGMMMGGAMGGQMSNMMNQMGTNMNQQANTPPQIPTVQFMLAVNGQQSGPYTIQQLQQLQQQGQFTVNTHVWKEGMANWELAANVAELSGVFVQSTPPPMPPAPPAPPVPTPPQAPPAL